MSETTPTKKRKALRILAYLAGGGVVAAGILWVAIHKYPPLASMIVDGVRAVVGPRPIAMAEDFAYGIQDRINRLRYRDAAPVTYWDASSASAAAPPPSLPAASGSASAAPPADGVVFPPPPFAPPFPETASPGDGNWLPVASPQNPSAPPALYKALIHPDPKRKYTVAAVVAVDLRRVEMHSVPGFGEPASNALERGKRPGLIPAERHPDLLAAFNGGFQAVHGHWGMMVDGVTLLAPRPIGCTVARYKDGSMKVSVWKRIADTEAEMAYYRQTPPCLVEDGVINPATRAEKNTGWGATVDGDTIIRRSAFGLDKTGKIAFYVMGDALSAGTLAQAIHTAGAFDAAQLDVNFAYPRFFFFDGASPPRITQPLAPLPNWKNDEYVSRAEYRDFFYLTLKKPLPRGLLAPQHRSMLPPMRVSEVMSRRVHTLSPRQTLREAARLLSKHDISGGPVVDEQGEVIGFLSRTDIIDAIARHEAATSMFVEDAMSREVIALPPEASIDEALKAMVFEGVHRVLIRSHQGGRPFGAPLGIVSTLDAVKALSSSRA